MLPIEEVEDDGLTLRLPTFPTFAVDVRGRPDIVVPVPEVLGRVRPPLIDPLLVDGRFTPLIEELEPEPRGMPLRPLSMLRPSPGRRPPGVNEPP